MSRSRNWCFTLNNYNEEHEHLAFELGSLDTVKYVVVGREVSDSGTHHLQGYVVFRNLQSLKQQMEIFSGAAHWEQARGNHTQASDYCKKDGDFYEHGELPREKGSGGGDAEIERWATARESAKAGNFDDIPADIYIRHRSTLHAIHREESQSSEILQGPLPHLWWHGEAGVGKTRKAFEEYPGAYLKDPKERWWDGYKGQDVVIIDDFDKYQVSQSGDVKRWLDRYPFQAPVKGGYIQIRPKLIIVTSNYHPNEIWDDEVTQSCISRRVTITRMGTPPTYPLFVPNFNPD